MTTMIGPRTAAEDMMARLLFVIAVCDPDDPAPPWDDLDDEVQRQWARKKDAYLTHLENEGWQRPVNYTPGHFDSALDIPEGGRFRPVGEPTEYERAGDIARRVDDEARSAVFMLSALDVEHTRGYTEAAR